MASYEISVTAGGLTDTLRMWAIFVDVAPGQYLGGGSWSNGNPLTSGPNHPGDTMTATVDLAPGNHDIFFVTSLTDPSIGTYSGVLSVGGQPSSFVGVHANNAADIAITVTGGTQKTVRIDGKDIPVPDGSTDALVMSSAVAVGGIPLLDQMAQAAARFLAQFKGYSVTGTSIVGSKIVVFVNSPTGGIIPALIAGGIMIAMVLIGIAVIAWYLIDIPSNNAVIISNNATSVAKDINTNPYYTPEQRLTALGKIAPYIGGAGGGAPQIPGWAVGAAVAVGAGVAGYLAYNIISNESTKRRSG